MADACLFMLSCYFLFSSEEAVLRQLPRLLRCELQRSLCESHLWLSLWERPHRSPFTRLQRATCCAVLLQFFLLANTLWYSIVVDNRYRYKSFFFFCLCVHCDNCIIYWWFVLTFECHPVLQPAGRFEVRLIKWRDGGGRCGDLSDRLPSLPARLHAVQNEPQQGTTNLPSNDNTTKAKCEAEYFLFVSVNVSVCLWSRCHHKGQTRSRWKLMTSWITQWLEVPSSFLMAR